MDDVFDFAENADHQLQNDNGYVGIAQGQEVSEAFPTPNLTVDITLGVAYDQLGQRVFINADQNLDLSVDSNALPTSVAGGGNEKWVSVFAAFDRVLSDPRVDGNGIPLQYDRAESFQFIVDQAAEAAAGTPAVYTSTIAEVYPLVNGQTLFLVVDNTPTQTITFLSGDFAAIGAATAAEVASVIQANTTGLTAVDNGGDVEIMSLMTGPTASVHEVGGTAAQSFAFPQAAAIGAGGPTRPALRADALLLADVLFRNGTTQIFSAPDPGPTTSGVIDAITRREDTFIFTGTKFIIREGTIVEFATALGSELDAHMNDTGVPHSATAIGFDNTGVDAQYTGLAVASAVNAAIVALSNDIRDDNLSPSGDWSPSGTWTPTGQWTYATDSITFNGGGGFTGLSTVMDRGVGLNGNGDAYDASSPVAGALFSANTVKAWAHITTDGAGGVTLVRGFNVDSVAVIFPITSDQVEVTFHNAFNATTYIGAVSGTTDTANQGSFDSISQTTTTSRILNKTGAASFGSANTDAWDLKIIWLGET